jgi:hypothetical protein
MRLPPNAIERLSTADPRNKAGLQAHLQHAIRQAFASGGWRAFEASERTAAYHEAGHCVLYALAGIPLRRVWIRNVGASGRRTWIGECQAEVIWEVSETSTVALHLLFARILLAGWLAECLFVPEDLRAGSSLDEVMLAQTICGAAAHKTTCRQADVFFNTMDETTGILRAYEHEIGRIASSLIRCRNLHGDQLSRLLPAAEAHDAG